MDDSFVCPHCGADLDRSARFCRECGADEISGWGEQIDGGEWSDDDFDYDDFLRREFPGEAPSPPRRAWIVAIVILVLASLLMAL